MNGLEIKPTKKREKLRVLNSAGGLYTISVVPLSAKHTVLACSQVMQGEATEGRRARVEIDVAFFAFVVGLSRSGWRSNATSTLAFLVSLDESAGSSYPPDTASG